MKRRTILTGCTMLLGIFLCLGLAACGGEKMQYDGLNLDDYITVGEYKGLEVDGYKIKVSEQEIQEKIEAALKEKQENNKLDNSPLHTAGFVCGLWAMSRAKHKLFLQGHPAEGARSHKSPFPANVWHKS